MRYPDGHKEEVRRRLVRIAAELLRSAGPGDVSIPRIMKRAGMTHGGFYTHFADRDELVAAAVLSAAHDTADRVFAEDLSLQAVVETYLSRGHLDHPAQGCVLAACGAEGSRLTGAIRRAFGDAAHGLLRLLEKKAHPESPPGRLADDTLVRASTMIGAVVLARLVRDEDLAKRILAAARRQSLA